MRFSEDDPRNWFMKNRFGMFVHWGIYACGGRHEQEQMRYDVPAPVYEKYAGIFDPSKFDPSQWLDMIQENGMQYLVFTAKHHDGFCMWDTKETDYNIMNTPYHRDIVGMLAEECHKRDFPLEIYYSCVDWHHPAYPNLGRHHEITTDPSKHNMDQYMDYLKKQITELCTNYGEIHGIWWDMNVPQLIDLSVNALIRKLQPKAVINNRGYDSGDYSTPERNYQAEVYLPFEGITEACDSISMNSWGYCADEDLFSSRKLERQIALYTSLGSNFLLNAGPKPDGSFPDRAVKMLQKIGNWYNRVKSALTAPPCPLIQDKNILCTGGGKELNLIFLEPPQAEAVRLDGLNILPEKCELLNTGETISFTMESTAYKRLLPPMVRLRHLPVERMYDEIQVVRMIFAEPVIHAADYTAVKDVSGSFAKE